MIQWQYPNIDGEYTTIQFLVSELTNHPDITYRAYRWMNVPPVSIAHLKAVFLALKFKSMGSLQNVFHRAFYAANNIHKWFTYSNHLSSIKKNVHCRFSTSVSRVLSHTDQECRHSNNHLWICTQTTQTIGSKHVCQPTVSTSALSYRGFHNSLKNETARKFNRVLHIAHTKQAYPADEYNDNDTFVVDSGSQSG